MSDASQPVFQIQRMYLKDLSLEIPGAPRIFLEQEGPAVEISIDSTYEPLTETIHEVTLTCTVTTKIGADKIVFLVEAKQAGEGERDDGAAHRGAPQFARPGTISCGPPCGAPCCISFCWYIASKLISARWIGGKPARDTTSAMFARRYG